MLGLVILASILIALVTVYQYREEAYDYHKERLQRKEASIRDNIDYVLKNTTYPLETQQFPLIFKNKIYEIKDIHNLEVYLYDLEGNLLKSSRASLVRDTTDNHMPDYALAGLQNSADKHFVEEFEEDGVKYQSSYSYITDGQFKPLAILNLPYIADDDFINKELTENLQRLAFAYGFMLLIAIALAYFLSSYITRSLNQVSDMITKTRLDTRNERIRLDENTTQEISALVQAYNSMVDELEASAARLAASEREAAWREMAKQVAHEIKNPLTPMRLTVQSFQRKFDPKDPGINEKMREYSNTLIQQIDTMSSIASAFSTYAKMPAQQDETLEVAKIVKLSLEIFNEPYIFFEAEDEDNLVVKFDRTQLIRVVTNLVKNSIQAIEQQQPDQPKVEVKVLSRNDQVLIRVVDNGIGIPESNRPLVFEPKFTTKTSGMGLGLAMVKKIVETYGGAISFTSAEHIGTTFEVSIPKLT